VADRVDIMHTPFVSESHHTKAVLEIAKPSDVDVATNHYLEIVTNLGIQK